MENKELGHSGISVPVIGMGTWNIAPPDKYAPPSFDDEHIVKVLHFGIEKGLTLIDTAEMYGNGQSEKLIGRAIAGLERNSLFIASKVESEHYHSTGVISAVEGSLERLGMDYIDLYQLHWPSDSTPIEETMHAMEDLVERGAIRFIGVSNFSVKQLMEAQNALTHHNIVSDQVKYNLRNRRIEKDLLPFAQEEGSTIIAYSPFDVGANFDYSGKGSDVSKQLAYKYKKSVAQIYLNWLVNRGPIITIPKAVQLHHLGENAAASGWHMDDKNYKALDKAF